MIDWLFLVLTAPTAGFWLYAAATTVYMVRSIDVLADVPNREGVRPFVTIVSPACNEQDDIERAVTSWLAHDDLDLQVIVVDDRSSDDTGAILDRLAEGQQRLTVVHVHELEKGWLGKVHALHRGVQRARGDWVLFADADVRLERGTIARAVGFAEAGGIDLVTAYPQIDSARFWGDVAWSVIGATLGPARLWRTRDPNNERAFGAGAFILVRRSAFEQTPGMSWLKLEVADDQGLAMLMKAHGHRCDIVNGRGLVKLTWYASFTDMVHKSQKNWFGILGRFSLARCVFVASVLVCAALSPAAALLPGVSAILLPVPFVGLASLWIAGLVQARWARRPLLPVLFAPLGMLLVAYMIARAGVIGRRVGGIQWRGVTYASDVLRQVQRFEM